MLDKKFKRWSLSISISDEARCYLRQLAAKDRRSVRVYLSVVLEGWYESALADGNPTAIECSRGSTVDHPALTQPQNQDDSPADDFIPMKKRW
jgi:hypothetical protein